jgi:hypothetical protein
MMFYDILQKECFRDVLLFYVWLIWCKVADYKRRHKHFVLFVIMSSAIGVSNMLSVVLLNIIIIMIV